MLCARVSAPIRRSIEVHAGAAVAGAPEQLPLHTFFFFFFFFFFICTMQLKLIRLSSVNNSAIMLIHRKISGGKQ
jgi:hypothetical protein